MSPKMINIITNITGVLLFILEPIRAYLTTQPFSWPTFASCVFMAVVAYFTGKSTLFVKK